MLAGRQAGIRLTCFLSIALSFRSAGRIRTDVPPVMSRALDTRSATAPQWATEELNLAATCISGRPRHRLGRCPFIFHERRAEKSNLTAYGRALVSGEAQDPAWFTLPGTAPGTRTQIHGV